MKRLLCIASAIAVTACGGGSDPVSQPPPSSGGGTAADFTINDTNLVRYQHGDFIEYTGTYKFTGAAGLPAFDRTITIRDVITLSQLPLVVSTESGDQETITRTTTFTASNGEVSESKSDIIQFVDIESAGTTLYTYRTYDGPYNYCPLVQDGTCYGKLELIGNYSAGISYDVEGFLSKGSTYFGITSWDSNDYQVRYTYNVKSKSVVSTPLGRFEVFPVDVYQHEIGNTADTTGQNSVLEGTLYVHPAIGVVKYVQKITESGNQVYNIEYQISRTNLVY